jgi:thymidylate synthase
MESTNFERSYYNCGIDILNNGVFVPTRTGINCKTISHGYLKCSNIGYDFPVIKGKRMYPKMALTEMMWFLNGRNDVQWLRDHKVTYWDEWEINSQEKLDKFNLSDEFLGTIGKSYGYQLRNFGGTGTDQLVNTFKGLILDPFGRRHILSFWNPAQYNQMALPPCFYDWNFQVLPGNFVNEYLVDLHVKARSIDYFLGLPYDLLLSGWLLTIMVKLLNCYSSAKNNYNLSEAFKVYKVRDIHFNLDNFHIYENHIDQVIQYLDVVDKDLNNIIDLTICANISNSFVHNDYYLQCTGKDNNSFATLQDEFFDFKKFLDLMLLYWDKDNFKDFSINYNFDKKLLYEPIKADVAV